MVLGLQVVCTFSVGSCRAVTVFTSGLYNEVDVGLPYPRQAVFNLGCSLGLKEVFVTSGKGRLPGVKQEDLTHTCVLSYQM